MAFVNSLSCFRPGAQRECSSSTGCVHRSDNCRSARAPREVREKSNKIREAHKRSRAFSLTIEEPDYSDFDRRGDCVALLQDHTDATLILAIVLASGALGFWRECSATDAAAKLRALVETKARVLRDGDETLIPLAQVVPGDVVLLSAGAVIPGDGRLLEACELFVNEAALTIRKRDEFDENHFGFSFATLAVVIVAALTPCLPFATVLGFQTMPGHFYPIIALIIFVYVAAAEATKALFYRKIAKA